MGFPGRRYQGRHAEASVLHTVIREHLDDLLGAAADRADGRVRVALKRAWSDGTTHLLLEPLEFLIRRRDSNAERPRYWTWAALMRRAFDLDVLRWPRCSGRMQRIATIDDPAVIQRILAHLGLPGVRDGPPPRPRTSKRSPHQPTGPFSPVRAAFSL